MPQMRLFVDTSVFLNFYTYSNDSVDDLRKLIGHIASSSLWTMRID